MLSKMHLQRCSRAACLPLAQHRAAAALAAVATAAMRQVSARSLPMQQMRLLQHPPVQQQQQQRCSATAAGDAASTESCIYDRPQLYDEAFSYRDFVAEAKFLMGAYRQHAQPGGKLRSVLELGCGPANHAIQLAKRGVQAWALDANPHMLQYAAQKAAAAGVSGVSGLTTVQGDMTNYTIKGMEGKFDMVVCLLGTLSHMLDNKQAAAAFQQATRHLRPGGLLLLELAHPGDLFDGSLLLQDVGAELWEVERAGRPKLTVMWGTDLDDFDPQTQVLMRTVSIHEQLPDGGDELGPCLLEEVVPYRQFTAQEVDLLATLSGLEVVGVYGDLDLAVSLTHEDAFRMVMCLRKQQTTSAEQQQ